MKTFRNKLIMIAASLLFMVSGCNQEWLEPDPLSFYSPENALVDKQGVEALLTTCEHLMRREYTIPQIRIELTMSDIATAAGSAFNDYVANIYPSSGILSNAWYNIQPYWEEWYTVIKYANTVISRIDDIEFSSEEEKNAVLGRAHFFRARSYYRLVFQFGDVPLVLEEITTPRLDFHTYTRESILGKMKADLEQYAPSLPAEAPGGTINRDAAYHLLTKINLGLGEFDDAIASATAIIDGGTHYLMRDRFGEFKNQDKLTSGYQAFINGGEVDLDVIWDLHRPENITGPENKEVLLAVVDRMDTEGNDDQNAPSWNIPYRSGMRNMRNNTPRWSAIGAIKTPSGANGMMADFDEFGQFRTLGLGEGYLRVNDYLGYEIWDDPNDVRGKQPNMWRMTDLIYNNSDLKGTEHEIWYGEHVTADSRPLGIDSMRTWAAFFDKMLNDDPRVTPNGANQDWYVYRIAETYLLRAEAYFWNDDLEKAADDVNEIRTRAGAAPLDASEINIGVILDERAKELFNEEPRKTELGRMAYLFAKTGKPCYNGNTYSMGDFTNKNFWFDRVIEKNIFYRNEITSQEGPKYRLAPHLVLWPIPESVILANSLGHINQTPGYDGAETNVEPKIYPDDYDD